MVNVKSPAGLWRADLLHNSPLAPIAGLFALGIWAAQNWSQVSWPFWAVWAASAGAGVVLLKFWPGRYLPGTGGGARGTVPAPTARGYGNWPLAGGLLLALAIVALGGCHQAVTAARYDAWPQQLAYPSADQPGVPVYWIKPGGPLAAAGLPTGGLLAVVCGVPEGVARGWRLVLCPVQPGGGPWGGLARPRIRVETFTTDGPPPAGYGDLVVLAAHIGRPQGARVPGDFDARRYWDARRLPYVAWAGTEGSLTSLGPYSSSLSQNALGRLLAVRQQVYQRLQGSLPPGSWGLAAALLFGEQGRLAPDQKQQFQLTGLAHLLAVSGLHVGLLAGFLNRALRPLLPLQAHRYLALVPMLAAVAFWTGGRPPVVRAAVMLALSGLQKVLRRPPAPLNSLGGAALLLLLYHPGQLVDMGFQLSFGAAAGIGLFTSHTYWPGLEPHPRHHWWRRLLSPLGAGLAAFLATAPIMLHAFDTVQPLSIVATPLAAPLVTLVLVTGLAVVPLVALFDPLTAPLARMLSWPLAALQKVAAGVAGLPFKPLPLPRPTPMLQVAYYALLLYALADGRPPLVRQRRPRPLTAGRILLFLVGLAALLAWNEGLAGLGR